LIACADILLAHRAGDVIACNRRGVLYAGAQHLDPERAALAERTNKHRRSGTPDEMLEGANQLLGVSGPRGSHPHEPTTPVEHIR
jgi:malate dehydrogenase (oxaloacetate-decarboxylating)